MLKLLVISDFDAEKATKENPNKTDQTITDNPAK